MLRGSIVWTGVQGAPYYTTLHTAGSTAGEAQVFADAISGLIEDLQGATVTGLVMTPSTEIFEVDAGTGLITDAFPVDSTGGVGGAGALAIAWAIQGLAQFRTSSFNAGRRVRGRMFLPGATEDVDNEGRPTSIYITNIQEIFEDYLTACAAGGGAAVYSAAAGLAAPIDQVTIWEQWAVLRSRRD